MAPQMQLDTIVGSLLAHSWSDREDWVFALAAGVVADAVKNAALVRHNRR